MKSHSKSRNNLAPQRYLHSNSWKDKSTVFEVPQSEYVCDKHKRITEGRNPALCGRVTEIHFIHF